MSIQAQIPFLLTRDNVADMLDVELAKLTWWLYALEPWRRYSEFDILRHNGEARTIHAPIQPIKAIQRTLADLLTAWYTRPIHVHGFVPERDIRTNAAPHRRQQWVLRVDLADFFPSINFGRVRGMFLAEPFEFGEQAATMLAQICCHDNQLPQGAPTSPIVSNYIARGLDRTVALLARAERCYFSRYADDLTFSTDRTVFPSSIAFVEGNRAQVGPTLDALIQSAGFMVNEDKTRLVRQSQRQRVTGLVVNRQLNVPREYVRTLRGLLYVWRRYGLPAADAALTKIDGHPNRPSGKDPRQFKRSVRGRVQYVGSVKGWASPVYLALAEALADLDDGFQRPTAQAAPGASASASTPASYRLYMCTEGQTDIEHLAAALRYFQGRGELRDLVLDFDDKSACDSDSKLQKRLRSLSEAKPKVVTCCLFDRDAPGVLREERLTQQDFDDRGHGVIAAALVLPPFRQDPACIEMLYSDDELFRRDSNGRRVYLRTEFNERTWRHPTENSYLTKSHEKALVRDDVFDFDTEASLALSKTAFAELVTGGQQPFENLTFEGFRSTLTMLREAARAGQRAIA